MVYFCIHTTIKNIATIDELAFKSYTYDISHNNVVQYVHYVDGTESNAAHHFFLSNRSILFEIRTITYRIFF